MHGGNSTSPITRTPHGTVMQARKRIYRDTSAATTLAPFEVYQHAADTPDPDSDWRTVRVHVGSAYGSTPDNTDDVAAPLNIIAPASTTDFKIWLAVMRDASSVTNCTIKFSGSAGTTSGGTSDQTGSGTSGWPHYPAQSTPSNVIWKLLAKVTTTADSGTGAKKLTINQVWTGNITDALAVWSPATAYQFLADFSDTNYAKAKIVTQSIAGISTTVSAETGSALTIADGDAIYDDITIDQTAGVTQGDTTAVTVSNGSTPTQPAPGANTPPATFYLVIAAASVDGTAKTISFNQYRTGSYQVRQIPFDIGCDSGNGFAGPKTLMAWQG